MEKIIVAQRPSLNQNYYFSTGRCAQAFGTIGDKLMRLSATFTLLTICLTAIGQTFPTKNDSWFRVDTLLANFANHKKMDNGQNTLNSYSWEIYTEIKYTYSPENVVIIQNSGPRGGRGFTDDTGIRFGYRVFCTRVINEAATPLELTITFPADSFALPAPDSYMKVFLLPDTMTHVKDITLGYDESLKSSYEAVRHTLPRLQRTINPKEAYLFHIVVLRHYNGVGVTPRGGFALKGQDLFYRIGPEFDSALIPCGQIVFKN